MKNAFRLVKNNPAVVGMHGFTGHGYLGLCTGQTLGNNYCPQNFEKVARARTAQAQQLWIHEPEQTMQCCQKYVDNITTEAEPNVHHPYSQANLDSLNQGMLDTNGNRNPPTYVGHVDDHLYADIAAYFLRIITCSI